MSVCWNGVKVWIFRWFKVDKNESKALVQLEPRKKLAKEEIAKVPRKPSLLAKNKEVRKLLLSKQVVYVLYCKEVLIMSNEF